MRYHGSGISSELGCPTGVRVDAGQPKYFLSSGSAGSLTVFAETGCTAVISVEAGYGCYAAPVTVTGGTASFPADGLTLPPGGRAGVKVEVTAGSHVIVNP
jgi:hypothetical protein